MVHGEGKLSEEMMDEVKSSNVNDVNNTAASEKIVDCPTNPMVLYSTSKSFIKNFNEHYYKRERTI